MPIKYVLQKNNLVEEPDKYAASVRIAGSAGLEQITDRIVEQGTTVRRPDVLAVLENAIMAVDSMLLEGFRVQLGGLCDLFPKIKGTFDGPTDTYDPARHQVDVAATPGKRVRDDFRISATVEREEAIKPTPSIVEYSGTGGSRNAGTDPESTIGTINGYRKKLEDLTTAMVNDIIDEKVREIVQQRLSQFGIECTGSKTISKEVWQQPLYMKCTKKDHNGNIKKIPIKKVRIKTVANNMILLNDRQNRPYRAVKPGGNHHIEIFEYTDPKGNIKRDGRVITLFEAVQRKKKDEPVIKKDYRDGKRFVCSLSINEMFMLNLDDQQQQLHRVQKLSSNGQIFFRPHTYAGDLQEQLPVSKYPNTLKGNKVHIDVLGRIYPAND